MARSKSVVAGNSCWWGLGLTFWRCAAASLCQDFAEVGGGCQASLEIDVSFTGIKGIDTCNSYKLATKDSRNGCTCASDALPAADEPSKAIHTETLPALLDIHKMQSRLGRAAGRRCAKLTFYSLKGAH